MDRLLLSFKDRPRSQILSARLDVGKQLNPVLILTATELFGRFKLSDFSALYQDKEERVNRMIWRSEIDEVCEFTQERYLGMPSSHEVRQEKRKNGWH